MNGDRGAVELIGALNEVLRNDITLIESVFSHQVSLPAELKITSFLGMLYRRIVRGGWQVAWLDLRVEWCNAKG